MAGGARAIDRSAARGSAAVLPLCVAVALLDGFDTQAIGPAAPAIAQALGLGPARIGQLFSASQAGFLAGAILFGMLGDRAGRKRALLLAVLLFAGATLATALGTSLAALTFARLVAGLGLGGATPNFVSLAAEYASPERKARVVTMLWAAVPFGGMLGSFASARLLAASGWQAVFVVGAALPVPILILVWLLMPESSETGARAEGRLSDLFRVRPPRLTILLWLASLATWTSLVATAFWLPSLLQRAGWSAPAAAAMLAASNAGGVVGTLIAGSLIGRLRPGTAFPLALLGTALFELAMALAIASGAAFAAAALIAGMCASASAGALLALSAALYPPALRSTGVGWALGVGRSGTIAGPLLIGLLVQQGHGGGLVFSLIALLAALGAGAAWLLRDASRSLDHGG